MSTDDFIPELFDDWLKLRRIGEFGVVGDHGFLLGVAGRGRDDSGQVLKL